MIEQIDGEETAVSHPIPLDQPTTFRIDVTPRLENRQGNGRSYVQAAHQLGYTQLTDCHAGRIYFLHGRLTPTDAAHIATHLLADLPASPTHPPKTSSKPPAFWASPAWSAPPPVTVSFSAAK
jgi:hypothetical protein